MVVHEDRERGSWCLGHEHAPDTAASSPKKGMVYESRRISTLCVEGRSDRIQGQVRLGMALDFLARKALSTVH